MVESRPVCRLILGELYPYLEGVEIAHALGNTSMIHRTAHSGLKPEVTRPRPVLCPQGAEDAHIVAALQLQADTTRLC